MENVESAVKKEPVAENLFILPDTDIKQEPSYTARVTGNQEQAEDYPSVSNEPVNEHSSSKPGVVPNLDACDSESLERNRKQPDRFQASFENEPTMENLILPSTVVKCEIEPSENGNDLETESPIEHLLLPEVVMKQELHESEPTEYMNPLQSTGENEPTQLHTGEKPLVCGNCGTNFAQPGDLASHMDSYCIFIGRRCETDDEQSVLQQKPKERHRKLRANETLEQRELRLQKIREKMRLRRMNESSEEREKRLNSQRIREQQKRFAESQEERQKRLNYQRLKEQQRRTAETQEEREKRLNSQRIREQQKRFGESQEERRKRLNSQRIREQQKRFAESQEEREKRLNLQRIREQQTRISESQEEGENIINPQSREDQLANN